MIYEELNPNPLCARFDHWPEEESRGFATLLLRMLNPDPTKRPTAAMLLKDPWLLKDKFEREDEIESEDDDAEGRETVEQAKVKISYIPQIS